MEEIDGLTPPEKWTFKDPYVRALCSNRMKTLKRTQFHYLDHWAETKPNDIALIEYDTGETVTWAKFQQGSKAFAARLQEYGLQHGDIIATSLPMLKEHVFLMYGCMRLGVIFAPLDLRLQAREISQCFEKIKPKMYFFLGLTTVKDFRPMVEELMKDHDYNNPKNPGTVKYWIQFQKSTEGVIKGALHAKTFAKNIAYSYIINKIKEWFGYGVYALEQKVKKRDPCLIIFTTGSTGNSKPALLHHRGILVTNLACDVAFFYPGKEAMKKRDPDGEFTLLCNLPPSHAAGLTGLLMTGIFCGTVGVLLHIFDPRKSLDAIQKHKVNGMAQVPACFNLQWAVEDYESFDLSSLEVGIYGGQSVSHKFLVKLEKMANRAGGLYGMTELAGTATYTPFDSSPDEIHERCGFDTPCARISVREPMTTIPNEESKKRNYSCIAGKLLPTGSVGEICFEGEAIFWGYLGMPEETSKCMATNPETLERVYYTGDLGSYDPDKGLQFHSRRKFVMKPKGYQVYPSEVEEVFLEKFKEEIEFMACVGIHHELYSQQVVAVISFKKKEEEEGEGEGEERFNVNEEELRKIAKEKLASYKRPSIYIFVEDFPLNRNRKRDYIEVQKIAEEFIKKKGEEEEEEGEEN